MTERALIILCLFEFFSHTTINTIFHLFLENRFFFLLEHEACIRDISELKWQLKLEKENLKKAQESLSHMEVLNQHFQEDINFAKKQVHIVKENLDYRRGIINQINAAQAEVQSNFNYSCFRDYS